MIIVKTYHLALFDLYRRIRTIYPTEKTVYAFLFVLLRSERAPATGQIFRGIACLCDLAAYWDFFPRLFFSVMIILSLLRYALFLCLLNSRLSFPRLSFSRISPSPSLKAGLSRQVNPPLIMRQASAYSALGA